MAPRRHRVEHALRQVQRQRLPLLTAAVVVVVIALVTVTISPQRSFTPRGEPKTATKAIPSSTSLTTPPKPGQPVKATKYTCPGYSGVETPNPVAQLYKDTFQWGVYPPYQVGDGKGDINWRSNPYNQPSWYMWLHSLRWLGQGIRAAGKGDKAAMARVTTIIHDWVNDNPYDWKVDVGAHEATMHRTNVLICTRQAILSGLKVKTLPATYEWLDKALLDHARFMEINFGGPGNHGTDESIAMFGVGCTLDREPLKELAQRRLARAITEAIDEQGSTNEQSTGYAQFNYSLWGRAAKALKECGADPGTNITTRRAALANWLAMATDSLGKLHQLGDSEVIEAMKVPGHRPTERVGIFDAGYIFGHTGWGEKRPLALESTYSIRFGPAPTLHGHDDHMSITYTSHGRQILIDGGHSGYQKDKWRDWVHSQAAHNVLTSPDLEGHRVETKLVRSEIKPTSEFYELADEPAPGLTRDRSVLVLKDPDLIVALDRATAQNDQPFETLWHLPEGQQVTVSSPTTAIAQKPGDKVKTVLLQIPYQEQLQGDAITVEQGQDDPVQGWHFTKATKKVPAPVVAFHRNGRSATILSLIVPAGSKEQVSYTTRTAGSTYLIDLTVGTLHTTIAVQADGTLNRLK